MDYILAVTSLSLWLCISISPLSSLPLALTPFESVIKAHTLSPSNSVTSPLCSEDALTSYPHECSRNLGSHPTQLARLITL